MTRSVIASLDSRAPTARIPLVMDQIGIDLVHLTEFLFYRKLGSVDTL